ncbi:M28 family peptidase [Patescibacteria group bacterium]|nr:M28 family peptidase [Patescibacteria group bacterium]MBU2081474.1 M28 family peptidase [Patescibacteria group bacterium]MBU2214875.1 M28 family peptidase [Patescibacteria group bacterium]MBU2250115.1 M28 family peptidase [Patescibacteria group bacterium]
MKSKFDLMKFTEKVCSFAPRLGKNEQLTADFLIKTLSDNRIEHYSQQFEATIPDWKKADLFADGKKIECKNTSLVSGKIFGKENIVSSFPDIDEAKTKYNINFSPFANVICTADFYQHPSVAVKYSDLSKIFKAKKVSGEVIVKRLTYNSQNILVGNRKNPHYLVFAHYDCIGNGGAVDNASGVATAMFTIINHPELLVNTLFIFSGCEEIAYDDYKISGVGFRKFEQTFSSLLKKSKRIYVLDGVGNGNPHFTQNSDLLDITLQIKMLKSIQTKVFLMQGNVDKIMDVYHSDIDTIDQLKETYLKKSSNLLFDEIKRVSK